MKTTVALHDLRTAVAEASIALARKTPLAVLYQLQLKAADGEMVVTGTDLDHWVSVRIPATVKKAGGVLLHGATLGDLVGKLAGPDITITLDAKGAEIASGRSTMRLATMEPEAFPIPADNEAEPEVSWEISAAELALLAHRVPFAVDNNRAWGALHGVNWALADGRMEITATNRTMMSLQVLAGGKATASALILPDVLPQVAKLFKGEETIQVTKGSGWIQFEGQRAIHRSKLMMEAYPTYRNVIPVDHKHSAVVDREALLAAVDLADVVSVDQTSRVRLSLEGDTLTVSGSSDKGEGAQPLPAEYEGAGIAIDAPAHQLRPVLQRIGSEKVRIELKTPHSVIVLKPHWEKTTPVDGEQIMLVMPLRAS